MNNDTERPDAIEEDKPDFLDGPCVEHTEGIILGTVLRRLESMYPFMAGHWQQVALQAFSTGEELDLSREALEQLRTCAIIMDIGMLDDSIHSMVAAEVDRGLDFMQNPDIRLAVERHSVLGSRKLEELGFEGEVVRAVRYHHEWFNGWGYPEGLSGVTIPLLSRVLSVADAFVSITRDVPFRAGCGEAEALEEIVGYAGVQFDPWVVPALEKAVGRKAATADCLIDIELTLEEFEA